MKKSILDLLEKLCEVSGYYFWQIRFFSDGSGACFHDESNIKESGLLFDNEAELIDKLKGLILLNTKKSE